MKYVLCFLLAMSGLSGFSQDTTVMAVHPDGRKMMMLHEGNDSVIISTYPGGKKEYERELKNRHFNRKYNRWYPNGKLMWQEAIKNNKRDGKCTYWHDNGDMVAELFFKNDTITDTLFLSRKYALILGHGTTSSIVHGGVYRKDDTIPKTPSVGAMINQALYVVSIKDENSVPELYRTFYTDQNGDFILCLPEGTYGFFPESYALKELKPGQAAPEPKSGPSWHSNWNPREPLVISEPQITYLHLSSSFVGYAP